MIDIWNEPKVINHFKKQWCLAMQQKMSLACFEKGENNIIGVSIVAVRQQDDVMHELLPGVRKI